ncbi:hypothetical protein [Bellilinea sp.]|jgi:Na+-transporting methylmalonyl-CoA/oxaloacetate decarboxylase gamma subunit
MMIFEMTKNDFLLTTAGVALALGVIMWLIGVIVLVSRVLGGEIKRIAEQTARLAQKGIAEEIAGLVGNASSLVESLNQLVRTSAGIGVFLVIAGMLMIAAAFGLAFQIQ